MSEELKAQESNKRPLRIMIAGAPAAGKGTQCVKIVEKVSCSQMQPSAGTLPQGTLGLTRTIFDPLTCCESEWQTLH